MGSLGFARLIEVVLSGVSGSRNHPHGGDRLLLTPGSWLPASGLHSDWSTESHVGLIRHGRWPRWILYHGFLVSYLPFSASPCLCGQTSMLYREQVGKSAIGAVTRVSVDSKTHSGFVPRVLAADSRRYTGQPWSPSGFRLLASASSLHLVKNTTRSHPEAGWLAAAGPGLKPPTSSPAILDGDLVEYGESWPARALVRAYLIDSKHDLGPMVHCSFPVSCSALLARVISSPPWFRVHRRRSASHH